MEFFYYWLCLALVSIIVELANPGFFIFLSFTCGAAVAALADFFGLSGMMQCLLMLKVSVLVFCLVISWWWRKEKRARVSPEYHSNVQALIGKKGIVIDAIPALGFGYVKIAGEMWYASSVHATDIAIGEEIEVVRIQDAHVKVKKVTNGKE